MVEADIGIPDVLGKLAAARGSGEAASGLVHVVVDGTGDIVELVIDPRAMRLMPNDLSDSIREAIHSARKAVQDAVVELAPTGATALRVLGEVGADLAGLGVEAQRRLGDFTAAADRLSRRLDELG